MKQTRTFPHEPESVPAARRFATGVLRGVSADTLEAVELMVSELATNCIRHTDSGFELTITRTRGDIRDRGDRRRRRHARDALAQAHRPERSRAEDHRHALGGVGRGAAAPPSGKTVWFTVPDTAASAAQASRA